MDAEMSPSGGFNLLIDLANGPEELQDGIVAIANNAPHGNISLVSDDDRQDVEFHWHLRFIKDTTIPEGECVVMTDPTFVYDGKQDDKRTAIVVKYHRKIEGSSVQDCLKLPPLLRLVTALVDESSDSPGRSFRSLGRILGASRQMQSSNGAPVDLQTLLNFTEKARYENLAVMVDCSRGGVLKQSSVFYLLRNCALMGINMLQLYTEDTYHMEGETFFGYLRGPYTQQELKNIDDYAFALGIELVPCIQTLGHLGQILQWPRFHIFRDTNEVLLANWDETYNLIEKMIRTVSAPLRSKKIHIGLDEAGGVGEGRYRQIFGYEEPSRVFLQHVKRVQDICKKLDLKPMIWSDTNKNNTLAGYYDGGTPQLVESLPPDIDLVYWDYYHTASVSYATKLQQHRELGCANPWLATAAWTWNRFWCALPFSFATIQAACQAAKRKGEGIQNMMLTIWGDEGHECDMFSSLPALHYFADHAYTMEDEVDLERIRYCFEGVIGGNYDDWVFASKIDQVTDDDTPFTLKTHFAPNTSKYLMWEDPFLSHISPQYGHLNLEVHYANVSNHLARALEFNEAYPQNARLRMAYLVSNVLGLKCHLHQRMVMAYQMGSRQDLYDLTEGRLVDLQVALDQLWKYHRLMWHKNNKPFGWEVIELRYGGLRTRLMTMRDRILEYIDASEAWIDRPLSLRADGTVNGTTDLNVSNEQQASQQQQRQLQKHLQARRGSQLAWNMVSDPDQIPSIPEFETIREPMYDYAGCNLLMDYARVSTPTRPG
ncbi:hypothetical protein BGW42_001388 [Actinomortierella wolfii]|nr:hypothetical protein BGW42_001388 [Actinomortierella wolfii]